MSANGAYYLTCESETYTKHQLALKFGKTDDWLEKNILYPCDPRTRRPLMQCGDCGREFVFRTSCPECGSTQIEMIHGCSFTRIGNMITIDGVDVKLWLKGRGKPRIRDSWRDLLSKLEEPGGVEKVD